MQLISKFNKVFRFLLCVIDIHSKYAWVISLKDLEGSYFYNRSMKSFLKINDIKIFSTHNERKFAIGEKFIRTLKNEVYKNVASASVYVDKLDDIVNKLNNTYHSTIKMMPDDVKRNAYIDASKKVNDKYPKFKIGEYQNIKLFLQRLHLGLKKKLQLKRLKILRHRHFLLMTLMEKKLLKLFTKTNCKKQITSNLE